ncbi:type II toxin-antitoxin system RnlB family antitoxin [Lutispora sp.]|uniref:type II toxin-antitoxin system RnlB family antitoxin n=1 Tax=Lutispora sp. TaxID=2828727 RepID=UPI00356483CA
MQEYEIFEFDDDVNEKMVLITSTEDLYYLQNDIYDDISKTNGEKFTILVDLFLRNGFSFNRFVSLNYKGKDRCRSFIVNPREVSEEIKLRVRSYLKTNTELLNNSALTRSAINFVTTGKT